MCAVQSILCFCVYCVTNWLLSPCSTILWVTKPLHLKQFVGNWYQLKYLIFIKSNMLQLCLHSELLSWYVVQMFCPALCLCCAVDEENGRLLSNPALTFHHAYPPTKLMFIPDRYVDTEMKARVWLQIRLVCRWTHIKGKQITLSCGRKQITPNHIRSRPHVLQHISGEPISNQTLPGHQQWLACNADRLRLLLPYCCCCCCVVHARHLL